MNLDPGSRSLTMQKKLKQNRIEFSIVIGGSVRQGALNDETIM